MYPGTLNNFVYSQWSIYRHTVKFEIYFLILDLTLSIVEVTNKIGMILLFLSDYYYFFYERSLFHSGVEAENVHQKNIGSRISFNAGKVLEMGIIYHAYCFTRDVCDNLSI